MILPTRNKQNSWCQAWANADAASPSSNDDYKYQIQHRPVGHSMPNYAILCYKSIMIGEVIFNIEILNGKHFLRYSFFWFVGTFIKTESAYLWSFTLKPKKKQNLRLTGLSWHTAVYIVYPHEVICYIVLVQLY